MGAVDGRYLHSHYSRLFAAGFLPHVGQESIRPSYNMLVLYMIEEKHSSSSRRQVVKLQLTKYDAKLGCGKRLDLHLSPGRKSVARHAACEPATEGIYLDI